MSVLQKKTQAVFEANILSDADKQQLIEQKIWQKSCPVALDRLRVLTISYVDFAGNSHNDGKIMVLDAVAPQVILLFKQLYTQRFPLASVKLINAFDGDDAVSMTANNVSCFNHRQVIGGSFISIHAYGLAIDINPIENPFAQYEDDDSGMVNVSPTKGVHYLNRINQRVGMVEPIVDLFKEHGFHVWGGEWNDPLDWQHFQPSRAMAEMLAGMEGVDATEYFSLYADNPSMLQAFAAGEGVGHLLTVYKANPKMFMALWKENLEAINDMSADSCVKLLQKH